MTVGNYSPKSIASYVREMRFISAYYPDTKPSAITADQIEKYICYLKQVFNSGRDKCRMVAASVSFFYKQILKRPYDLPSKLYPRKEFKLPNVMTHEEVRQLLACTISIKQAAVVQLFYKTYNASSETSTAGFATDYDIASGMTGKSLNVEEKI